MKCPECDLEQPDHAAVCAGCGLNFALWRIHAGESIPAPATPEDNAPMEEKTPAENKEEEISSTPAPSIPEEPSPGTSAVPTPGKSKEINWSLLYSVGLGLIVVLGIVAVLLIRKSPPASNNPANVMVPPTIQVTSSTSATPDTGAPIASPAAGNTVSSTPSLETPSVPPSSTPSSPSIELKPTILPTETTVTLETKSVPTTPVSTSDSSVETPTSPSTPNITSSSEAIPSPTTAPKDLLESSEGTMPTTPTASSTPSQ